MYRTTNGLYTPRRAASDREGQDSDDNSNDDDDVNPIVKTMREKV